MAFRRFRPRFQSGTLGRSIRRFGRFPRPGFQRKQFGFYYANAFQQFTLTGNPEPIAVSLVSQDELAPATSVAAGAQVGVRSVSIDLDATLQMVPDSAATGGAFGFLYVHWMVFKQDVDEDITTFEAAAATNSAIKWGVWPVLPYGTSSGSAGMGNNPTYVQQTRMRFRVNKLDKDEELVFLAALSQSEAISTWFDGAGIQLVQRVRYEIP